MRKLGFILLIFCCTTAYAHVLHVGDKTFQLDTIKRTSPAVGVGIGDDVFYGALYSGSAPSQTLHVRRGADEYWLGQNCAAGKYSETGISECTDCGFGHYCTGGSDRNTCTYGAISCNTKNTPTDAPMPDGAPINNFMTLDEVNEFIPVTDFSDWRKISCCSDYKSGSWYKPEILNDVSNACATGTIGPGTYLFTARYDGSRPETDSINGQPNQLANAFIAVFDHPVGYASIHGHNIFQHFVDTENANYTAWTISTTRLGTWQVNKNATNITNLADLPNLQGLCVYELK